MRHRFRRETWKLKNSNTYRDNSQFLCSNIIALHNLSRVTHHILLTSTSPWSRGLEQNGLHTAG